MLHRGASVDYSEDRGPAEGQVKTILLVEDDLDLAVLVQETLEDLGYEVVHAENASAALSHLQSRQFDLLFSDIIMPGPMNGVELAIRSQKNYPALPILLVTGNVPEESLKSLQRFPILRKPYRVSQLQKMLRDLGLDP